MPGFLMSMCCKQGQIQLLFLLSIKKNNTHLKFSSRVHISITIHIIPVYHVYMVHIYRILILEN